MKIEVQDQQGNFKKIVIEVPAERVDAVYARHYMAIQQQATLKGFRKGKAPLAMIKAQYGNSIDGDVVREVVDETLRNALKEQNLEPAGMPEIQVESILEGAPLKYSATFEHVPPVELKKYTGYKAAKKANDVSEDEIEKTMENIRQSLAKFEDVTDEGATANAGLHVLIDFEAQEAGKVFEQATAQNSLFGLGSGELFPDFEANVLGMKVGETRNFTVKFPLPEKEEEKLPVSGKTLDFTVTLKGLRKKVVPVLSDENAKQLGPFESLAALRERVQQDISQQKQQQQRREAQEEVLKWLIEQNPCSAPETLLARQMEQLVMDSSMQLAQMGLDEKAIEERLKGWESDMTKRAEGQVKASLLLSALAKKENIVAGDEELRREIVRIAMQEQKNPKEIFETLQKRGLLGALHRQVTELKALDWLVDQALA